MITHAGAKRAFVHLYTPSSCLYQRVPELSEHTYPGSVLAYRRSAHWPIGWGRLGAYLRAMTTYTTPQFATGASDRALNRARPASAATYRTAGVSNEAAILADGPTPDWQPGVAKGGVPKAAIGALGAALVGGIALAIVLLAPSNKVTKQVMPDPIAQATAQNNAAQKSVDSSDAAVNELNSNAPAAGNATAAKDASATQPAAVPATTATPAAAAAVPAPVQSVTPDATPVANAPVARVQKHAAAPVARAVPQPTPAAPAAPVVTPDVPAAPSVTPPADVQAPAMQQTPDTPTVTPSTPAPTPTPDVPAPAPTPSE